MQTFKYKTPVSVDMPTWIAKFPVTVRDVVVKAHMSALRGKSNIREESPGLYAVVSSHLYRAYYVSGIISLNIFTAGKYHYKSHREIIKRI